VGCPAIVLFGPLSLKGCRVYIVLHNIKQDLKKLRDCEALQRCISIIGSWNPDAAAGRSSALEASRQIFVDFEEMQSELE